MTTAVAHHAKPHKPPAHKAPATAENEKELIAADVDVHRLFLDVVKKGVPGIEVSASVLDARVRQTMTGAPTFTLQIHDPELKLLRSSVLWTWSKLGNRIVRPVDIDVDDHPFRLVSVDWDNASSGRGVDLTLTFEHLIVAYLRRHDSRKKVSRNKATLAEFIQTFAREVKTVRIRFVCKELHKKQPIAKLSHDDSLATRDKNRDPGLDTSADIKVKGKTATKAQKKTIETVLRQGEKKDIEHRGLVMAVMAVTQESIAGQKKSNPANPNVRGSFHQDASYGTVAQRMDDAHAANGFFTKLAKVLKAHKSGTYGDLIDKVQISGNPHAYQQWKEEAAATVKAFTGSGSESTHRFVKGFNYTRGVDGKRENSWDCSQRYAQLVNFRSFVVGKATWVYESEPVLFKSRSRMTIHRDHPAVISIGGQGDVGKRAQTIRVRARVVLWDAPPGSVVTVKGEGLGDDRWLVEDIERSLYSPESDITLKRPTEPKAEPAPDVGSADNPNDPSSPGDGSDSSSGGSDKSAAMALYINAKRISDMNLPYVYGGGHGPPLDDIRLGKISSVNVGHTRGLDCSSSCSLALFRAGLWPDSKFAAVSGGFGGWGHSGEGKYFTVWYNSEHVWIQFHGLGNAWRFDTSPYGSGPRGPHLRFSPRPTAGFQARHWPGL